MPEQIRYAAPPTLARMLRSNSRVRLAVGPRGSGKSSACISEVVRRGSEQAPFEGVRRTKFVVIRNTYRELKDTTIPTFKKWLPEAVWSAGWRVSDFTLDIKARMDDGTMLEIEVLFRSLDQPGDTRKVLSLEVTGAYINEAKEIPKAILDGIKGAVGRFPPMDQGGPTWHGVWMDTNPWPVTHWGYKLFKNPPTGFDPPYKQPGGRAPDAENLKNLVPGYYADLASGAEEDWILAYVDGEYPQSQSGAIYATLLERYQPEEFDAPRDGVFASYDLGFTDSTAIWFWRVNGMGGLDFVDHYENHGQPLSHYFDEVEKRAWKIVKHWLPHDAAAHTLATGSSVEDQFRARYPGKVQIGPSLSLLDGIQAGRWLLEQGCRFHARCGDGLEALRSYHYEWDDDTKTYSKKPEHDWSSHTADSFRYAAIVAKFVMRISRKALPPPEPIIPPIDKSFTLDQLWALHGELKGGRERV